MKKTKNVSLSLVAQLDFASETVPSYYEITRSNVDSADSITVGNPENKVQIKDNNDNNVSSVQKLLHQIQ